MRKCVIFNPAARGEKSRRFRTHLDYIGKDASLKLTAGPGDARKLAAQAVEEGFQIVVAAGGDGTLNEVLNGIGDAPSGFERAALGVLPLGTVNVFAREVGISPRFEQAWQVIEQEHETRIDLPSVEYEPLIPSNGDGANGKSDHRRERRYFAQLAGAGLDARAIELVKWQVKKLVGPLAYVLAGFQAMISPPSRISISGGKQPSTAGLVMIGNGRLYGGQFNLFPGADLRDGLLEVCILPRVTWFTLARSSPPLLLSGRLPGSVCELFQSRELTLSSDTPTPVQADGELIGRLPATFRIQPRGLRVIVPKGA